MNLVPKRIFLLLISGLMTTFLFAQNDIPKGWHLLDKATTGYYGISIDKAYEFLKSKKLKSNTVIVAVIDSGIDTTHEDLKSILWSNPKEIPGNGIDDDKNGYVDDIHGWNFLGAKDNSDNVETDSYEAARVYHGFKSKWGGKTVDVSQLSKEDKYEYESWKRAEIETVGDSNDNGAELIFLKRSLIGSLKADSVLQKAMGKAVYTGKELENFTSDVSEVKKAKNAILGLMNINDLLEGTNQELIDGFSEYVNGELKKAEAREKAPENYRSNVVKDNYSDFNDKFYGNANVFVSNKAALHGTHVSGIIAAARGNNAGMDGVADNVKIMMIRAVPDGDEHDKDIALGIRYAVDNGAQVINMSFGKDYSPEKAWVDDAVRYAQSKGVLLVHAAGNDSKNVDTTYNFPSPAYITDGKRATNWITVGASGDPIAGGLTASFSNYGKKEVDVFAPGVKIWATVPGGNTYQSLQGTSMASPVVAGLAALILEYFPTLSAEQVKMVIEKSSSKISENVIDPGTGEEVKLSDISKTGGIINAYSAVKLAATLKGERKLARPATKSIVTPKVKG